VESSEDPTPAPPVIGHRKLTRAQRKDIKKVHVPKGVVMQYEGELVDFLDQLTLSDPTIQSNNESSNRNNVIEAVNDAKNDHVNDNDDDVKSSENHQNSLKSFGDDGTIEDSNWVFVQSSDALGSEPVVVLAEEILGTEDVIVTVKEELKEKESSADTTTAKSENVDADTAGTTSTPDVTATVTSEEEAVDHENPPQIYLRWDIQDQFLRFIAHALCSFYGLVSFSKLNDQSFYLCKYVIRLLIFDLRCFSFFLPTRQKQP
jgi:hypothetical protein